MSDVRPFAYDHVSAYLILNGGGVLGGVLSTVGAIQRGDIGFISCSVVGVDLRNDLRSIA